MGEELVNAALMADPAFASARTVLLYRAKPPELSVVSATLYAWRTGKTVVFPRVAGDKLTLHRVDAWAELEPGAFGIEEPRVACPEVSAETIDLAVVPGVAFDAAGGRLGQGGGFYDRLLPDLLASVGVAFDEQMVAKVPLEPHDVPVGRVINPTSAQM